MYAIYAYIGVVLGFNIGTYSIHGVFGIQGVSGKIHSQSISPDLNAVPHDSSAAWVPPHPSGVEGKEKARPGHPKKKKTNNGCIFIQTSPYWINFLVETARIFHGARRWIEAEVGRCWRHVATLHG